MEKEQAKKILLEVINSLKLTKKEYDTLILCLEVLEKKD